MPIDFANKNCENCAMKNINTPIAILIGALIIAVAAIIIGTKDPLAKCMDKIIKDGRSPAVAARLCTGG